MWSVLCWRNHSQTSLLWQFPSNYTVTMWSVMCWRNHSQTSLLWQFPSSYTVTMWSVLCWRNHSQTSLLWQFPSNYTVTMWSVMCWRNHSQTSLLWQFPSNYTVTMWSVMCWRNHSQTSLLWQFPSSHSSDNVVLCCVEETTAKLVYCDSFLPITAETMWSVLCWRNPSQTSLLWQFPSSHSRDNVVLCCVEETTAKLVYCDSFLPVTAETMWSVLCWRNHSQTSLLWQFPSSHSRDNVVCVVLKKPQPN